MKKVKSQTLTPFLLTPFLFRLFIFMIVSFSMVWGNISLDGYLHPGDNDLNNFTPTEPLTKKVTSGFGRWITTENEHTYDYYTNNPTRFYLSQTTELTGVSLQDPEGIDGKLYIWIDGDIVATGNSGESTVDFSLSLSKGYHSIAITGDCYLNGSQVSCSDNPDDIDDFNFSGITLLTAQTTSAYHFIQRRHIGDNNDDDDNYDIDETSYSYYPDAYEAQSVTYDINDANNYAGFEIYLSRVRDIYQDKINKIILYDTNGGVITSFDLDTSSTYTFDFNALYENNISNIGYITISSGKSDLGDYDDISFGELIFIPLSSEDLQERKKPIIDYHMDECSWDNDSNTYEIKNFGTLGNDYNASAINNANTIDDGKIYRGGDINSSSTDDKAILAKTDYSLPDEYTMTTWIKFPLNTDGHTQFRIGNGRNSKTVEYFNIADRVESENDYIYFTYNLTDNTWSLSVNDDDDTDTIDFNPQDLSGWHMLTFIVTDDGTDFYLDKDKNDTFSTHPNTGELGLLFNSDYDDNNDNEANGQSIGADVDEFQIFHQALDSNQIEDIFNYDGSDRSAPQCGGGNQQDTNSTFNAVGTLIYHDAVNDWDNNLTTQIVKKAFSIYILSKDTDTNTSKEANITKVVFNFYNNGDEHKCSGASYTNETICDDTNISNQCPDTNSSGEVEISDINITKASKCIEVYIKGRDSNNTSLDSNESNASDDFAIRPNKFIIADIDNPLKAGDSFDFNVTANATDYNTTGISVDVNLTKDCSKIRADFNISTIDFSDGESNNTAKFSDIGVADINITDKDWASVDNDDTPQNCDANGTYICLDPIKRITILPDHFNVISSLLDFNKDNNFTYLSQDLNMSVRLDLNITAQNEQNGTTENYNSECYAKNIDINISHNNIADVGLSKILYIVQNASDKNSSLNDVNKTKDINITSYSKENFTTDHNGTTFLKVFINFDRNYSKTVNPFDFNITDINVSDENNTFGTTAPDNNATFYYGRVKTKDITTNKKDVNNTLHVEVYSDSKNSFVDGFHQESLNWYKNEADNDTNITTLIPQEKFAYNVDTNKSGITLDKNSSISISSGIANFTIKNSWNKSDNSYIHVEIPSYLWYNNYQDYNFSDGSDCASHPCFQYIYNKDGTQTGIQSGDFNGSNIGYDYNATKTKKGIKVFR